MTRPTYAALRESTAKLAEDMKALNAQLSNAWCCDVTALATHREAKAHLEQAQFAVSQLKYVLNEFQGLTPADMAEAADAVEAQR